MLFMPIKNKKIFPLLVLIFLSMIWGSSFILIKKGLLSFTPIQVSALRIFFASIVLLPIAVKYIPEFKIHWKIITILGFISNLLPAFLIAIAETKINSSLAGMLNSLTPITTMVIGALFFGTKFTFKLSIGLFIGLIGSLVLSFVSSNGELGSFNFYVLYVVAVTLLYGLSGNMVKDLVEKINPLILVPLELMAMLPLTIIILLSTNVFEQITTHDDALFSLAALFTLGAASTSIAGIIYIKLVKQTTAVFAAASTYLIPIMAITWGLFDNEVLFPLHFVGVGLIIVGVLLVNRFR
jgi:drug/metabolite transporter (DMT)-like permease